MAKYRKLGRTSNQRKALLRNQVTQLLYHGKIRTTEAKAKEIRKIAEGLIALGVKEKDNFEVVKVQAKVAKKDAEGKRVKEVVDGKKVTVYETVEKEISDRTVTLNSFIKGFKRFILGLAKKVIIANNVAYFCDFIYNNYSNYGSSILWVAAICYTLQIYFDFSGYSDMAIGLGKMFGFNFLENFNYPYISTSITDFWRRWHISLSSFFRDYVYIPLGGNRVSKVKFIRNIFIVWLLTGIWHGASYNFILWGLYYAILLLIEKLFTGKLIEKMPRVLKTIYSLFFIIIGWVIFRVENISDLGHVLQNMFNFTVSDWSALFKSNMLLITCIPYILLGIVFSMPIDKWFSKKVNNSNSATLTLIEDFILGLLFGFSIMLLVSSSYNPFIYFRF